MFSKYHSHSLWNMVNTATLRHVLDKTSKNYGCCKMRMSSSKITLFSSEEHSRSRVGGAWVMCWFIANSSSCIFRCKHLKNICCAALPFCLMTQVRVLLLKENMVYRTIQPLKHPPFIKKIVLLEYFASKRKNTSCVCCTISEWAKIIMNLSAKFFRLSLL